MFVAIKVGLFKTIYPNGVIIGYTCLALRSCNINHANLYLNIYIYIYVTRHAKRYELGGRRHFEKIRLKITVASRKNSTSTRVVKRRLTYYKTDQKRFSC